MMVQIFIGFGKMSLDSMPLVLVAIGSILMRWALPNLMSLIQVLEEAPEIFMRDFAQPLEVIFQENQRYQSPEITVFTEFFGYNSFAGMHKKDDPKELVLFDVQIDRGIVVPEQFIQDFGSLKIAQVIYRGKLTGKFIEDVRQGKYGVFEGVVCKGGKNANNLWMVKIKTYTYLEKLKQAFQRDWESYWE